MVRELILITHIKVDNGFQIYRTTQKIIDCASTTVYTTSVTNDIFYPIQYNCNSIIGQGVLMYHNICAHC